MKKCLYLLAILPPEGLSQQIDDIRKECAEKFKVYKALKPPVHITLYRPFFIEESYEKTFCALMKQAGQQLKPFTQEIANFGTFGIQVVYINALKSTGLANLRREVVSVFRKHHIDSNATNEKASFHPHVTIAYRDVLPEVFPKIWDEYKDRTFKRKFDVNTFALLKHDGRKWNLLARFQLDKVDQPTLF